MTDTPVAIEELLRSRYAARSPAERVAMATSLFTTAKELARAGILLECGEVAAPELRRRLFLRLYERDFAPALRADILRAIGSHVALAR